MTDFGSQRKPPMAARISFFVAQLSSYATRQAGLAPMGERQWQLYSPCHPIADSPLTAQHSGKQNGGE